MGRPHGSAKRLFAVDGGVVVLDCLGSTLGPGGEIVVLAGQRPDLRARPPAAARALEAHDEADDFGHGLEVFAGNDLVHVDRGE